MFSTLAGHHREFADSLMHSIKHNFEPHNTSNYLEVYLFLPQQPPPYFIRFNLPNTHASELGPGNANHASAYLDSCTVSFIAHTTSTMPSRDNATEFKFKFQPTILF